jgi:hypothetical protein
MYVNLNSIGCVVDSILASSVEGLVLPNIVKLVFVVSLLSRYHLESQLILAASVM